MAKSCLVREILHVLAIVALFHQLLLATNAVPEAEWSQVDVNGHDCLQNTLHGPACLQEIALERAQTSATGELESAEYNADTQEINMVDMPVAIATSLAASPLVFQTSFSVLTPCLTTPIIRPPRGHEPPARLVVAVPTGQSGTFPVILFKHGFALANCFYTQLFQYLVSSGFIVVAPQAVTLNIDTTAEIKETAEVANWILKSLAVMLSAAVPNASIVPDLSKLVMAGHSRGGKVAFALALRKASVETPSFSALVALDPVDGTGSDAISNPPIVAKGCDHAFNHVPSPVLILGTGYGTRNGIIPGTPPCAPTCCNHAAYFNCSSSPMMYHFLASEFGHMDFLDDAQSWTSGMCMWGSSKAPLRDFTGRLVVAFLEFVLQGKEKGMADMVDNWETLSIKLEEPQIFSDAAQSDSF